MYLRLLPLFLIFPLLGSAQVSTIDIANLPTEGDTVTKYLTYFPNTGDVDYGGDLDKLPLDSFITIPNKSFADFREYDKETNCWFRFEIYNSSNEEEELLLLYGLTHNIRFYICNDWERTWKDTVFHSDANSLLGGIHRFGEIILQPGERKKFFIHKTKYGNFTRLFEGVLFHAAAGRKIEEKFWKERGWKNTFRKSFLSIVLAFSIFTLLQYFVHRDRSYLLYGFYLLYLFVSFLWRHSIYGWTPFSSFFNDYWEYTYGTTHYATIALHLLFFRSFFSPPYETDGRAEKFISVTIRILLTLLIFDVVLVAFGYVSAARFVMEASIPLMLAGGLWFVNAIRRSATGAAKYILYGALAVLVTGMIEGAGIDKLSWFQPIVNNFYDPVPFGMLVEIMFFGLALSYRTKMIQEEKERALFEKEHADRKAELFVRIAHDFRTPLSIIDADVEILQPILNSGRVELNRIRRQVLELSERLNGIPFHFSGKRREVSRYKHDVVGYLNELIEMYSPLALKNNIKLSFKSDGITEWEVDFCPEAIKRIVENLVTNAINFTSAYKKITVTLGSQDDSLIIRVTDEGKGMSEADTKRIFDPYVRVGDENGPGMGLGLNIVKDWVDYLDGEITVESKVGYGTTFTIILPATYEAAELPPGKSLLLRQDDPIPTTEHTPFKSTILLVEDNLGLQSSYQRLLAKQYNLFSAVDGRKGFELAKANQPDLILTDVMMPEMNGMKLLEKLSNDPETKHIPVIVVTARTAIQDERKALSLKANDYITKPFKTELLLLKIANLLLKKTALKTYKDPVRWKGKVVTDKFMKAAITILEKEYRKDGFDTTRFLHKLRMGNFGAEKKVRTATNKHFKLSPASLLKTYRLDQARELVLHHQEMTFTEISQATGLGDDPSNFRRMYEKHFGITPGEERVESVDNQ